MSAIIEVMNNHHAPPEFRFIQEMGQNNIEAGLTFGGGKPGTILTIVSYTGKTREEAMRIVREAGERLFIGKGEAPVTVVFDEDE
jgi:hypothetical protein